LPPQLDGGSHELPILRLFIEIAIGIDANVAHSSPAGKRDSLQIISAKYDTA
jgi:hypothetical protein